MIKYYRGHIRSHAAFWVKFRDLPHEERFNAFVDFFQNIKNDVEGDNCTLRDAGYALKPGFYDADIYDPREVELSFAQDAIEDLIIEAVANPEEAKEIWAHIVDVMEPYL